MQGQGIPFVIEHPVVVGAVELQALADADQPHVRLGQRPVAVAARLDGGQLGPRPAPDFLPHAGPGAVGGVLPALAADVDQVVGNVFLVPQVQRLLSFCVNRINSSNLETRIAKHLQQTFPDRAFLIGMVKSEDQ